MKVYQAINAVQADLAKEGIGKDRRNQEQKYNFRGIDDVYNAVASLLAKHKLVVLPHFSDRIVTERTSKSGTALHYISIMGRFELVSAEDGSKHEVTTYGEAMDTADKATNKAMSAAYKYMALQVFCIPTEGDNDTENAAQDALSPDEEIVLQNLRDASINGTKALETAWTGATKEIRRALAGQLSSLKDAAKKSDAEREPVSA